MGPILCNYYLTYRCNARCGFCDIWERPSPLASPADVHRNLQDLKQLGVRIIDFTGGEPLLHPQLAEFLEKAHSLGQLTTVTTNGLLYPKQAHKLAGLIDLLHFSIDAATPEAHNTSRGVRCFDKLMESIEIALSLGESPDLLFTVTNQNFRDLPFIYEQISYPNKLILILNPIFQYHTLGETLQEEAFELLREYSKKPYVYLNPAFITLRKQGGNAPDNPLCRAVSTTVVISPFNELLLPCYHAELERLPIQNNLCELWQSERVAWHRAHEGRHAVCKGCTINCYFEPSFATMPHTRYFWEGIPSKLRYIWTKFIVQRMRAKISGPRTALLPDFTNSLSADPPEGLSLPVLPSLPHYESSP